MTKYRRTMDLILRLIDEDGLQPGDRLPPEPVLAQITGVSMITLRRAMGELVAQGVLQRVQGKGTFVARGRLLSRVAQPGPLRAGFVDGEVAVTSQVVRFGRIACPTRAARFLGLQPADQCWEVLRTRSAGTIPSLLDLAIVPTTLAPLLSRTDLEGQASLYSLLDVRYGLQDSRDEQVLSVVVPLNEERTLLGLADGGRLVAVEGVSFTPSNLPFAYFRLLFDADRFAFRVDGVQASIVPVPRDSEIRPMRPMP